LLYLWTTDWIKALIKLTHSDTPQLAVITEKLAEAKRQLIKFCLSTIFILCTIQITSVHAASEGSSRLDQGVNDNSTGHETVLQTALETVACTIFLRVLAVYKIP